MITCSEYVSYYRHVFCRCFCLFVCSLARSFLPSFLPCCVFLFVCVLFVFSCLFVLFFVFVLFLFVLFCFRLHKACISVMLSYTPLYFYIYMYNVHGWMEKWFNFYIFQCSGILVLVYTCPHYYKYLRTDRSVCSKFIFSRTRFHYFNHRPFSKRLAWCACDHKLAWPTYPYIMIFGKMHF